MRLNDTESLEDRRRCSSQHQQHSFPYEQLLPSSAPARKRRQPSGMNAWRAAPRTGKTTDGEAGLCLECGILHLLLLENFSVFRKLGRIVAIPVSGMFVKMFGIIPFYT